MTRLSIVVGIATLIPGFAPGLSAAPPAAPLPSPTPVTTPAQLLAVALFTAIADHDIERLRLALNAGADPNTDLPHVPESDALRQRFADGEIEYYFRREPGYTALMFAAAIGNEAATRYLLLAGADRHRLSKHSGTFALWQAARNGHIEIMRLLMGIGPKSESAQYRVDVDLATQRATVWKGLDLILTTEISSGRESKPTPPGRYLITDKYRDWKSTIYPARMPYFLRLSCANFGLHAGVLPGYPASHGCVRLPPANAKKLFALLPIGTYVEIH